MCGLHSKLGSSGSFALVPGTRDKGQTFLKRGGAFVGLYNYFAMFNICARYIYASLENLPDPLMAPKRHLRVLGGQENIQGKREYLPVTEGKCGSPPHDLLPWSH